MDCSSCEAELAKLREELAKLREEAAYERAQRERQGAMLEEALATIRTQAEALVTLASNAAGTVTVTERNAGTVTLEGKEGRKRDSGRVRQQNYRHRRRHASLFGDALSTVTPPPPPPSFQGDSKGNLRVVTQAARYAAPSPGRVTRNPEELPEDVRALREAWNELVAPHGFPDWRATSPQMLADAVAALGRRPVSDWRVVFQLVPRSPVCRGELSSRLKYTVVKVLGFTTRGDEVADCLLSGAWSIDPPAEEQAPEPGSVIDLNHVAPGPEGQEAVNTWQLVLEQLRLEGMSYTLKNIDSCGLAPVAVRDDVLVMWCKDEYALGWIVDVFSESLAERLSALGVPGGARFVTTDPLSGPHEMEARDDVPKPTPFGTPGD